MNTPSAPTSSEKSATGTRLVLLRHGQTDWNAEMRLQGRSDIPLNEAGLAQAHRAAVALAETTFAAIYASPLIRARLTAEIVAPGRDIILDDRLMEINVGLWEGKTWAEVQAEMPDYEAKKQAGVDFRRSATGESLAEVTARVMPAMTEIAARHQGETVLVVAHGMLLDRVLHSMLGLEQRVLQSLDNCHRSVLLQVRGAWRLESHNVAPPA